LAGLSKAQKSWRPSARDWQSNAFSHRIPQTPIACGEQLTLPERRSTYSLGNLIHSGLDDSAPAALPKTLFW